MKKFKVGDRVRLNRRVKEFKYIRGDVSYDDIGTIEEVCDNDEYEVKFPSYSANCTWSVLGSELRLVERAKENKVKVFSKEKYIKEEGYEDYMENRGWVDECDGWYVGADERCYPYMDETHFPYFIENNWCVTVPESKAKINRKYYVMKDEKQEEVQEEPKDEFKKITEQMYELYKKKNADYGNSVSDTYKDFGLTSFLVRMQDKLNRAKTLTKKDAEVEDEKIEDTLIDLANYSILAVIEMRKDK